MSWETILKISTKDAIADARRHMSEDDKEPKMELSNLNPPAQSPAYEITMKNVMKGLYRGYKVMKNSLSLIPDELKVIPRRRYVGGGVEMPTSPSSMELRLEMIRAIMKVEENLLNLNSRIGELSDSLQEAVNAEEKLQ
jgi:hypothetical protein|tara:strand:+ start:1458 stop:1874 length:417 start_codon:yes stop_codon:yes gene_type:complete